MAERRGMGDAMTLSSEKLAFIQGGQPASSTVTSREKPLGPHETDADRLVTTQAESTIEPAADVSAHPTKPRRSREPAASRSPDETSIAEVGGFYGPILVPLTTRLQPKTADSLRRACLEQKLARRTPNTQQEIVELAVAHWLKEHRYL